MRAITLAVINAPMIPAIAVPPPDASFERSGPARRMPDVDDGQIRAFRVCDPIALTIRWGDVPGRREICPRRPRLATEAGDVVQPFSSCVEETFA
jgi:hypothetical protein